MWNIRPKLDIEFDWQKVPPAPSKMKIDQQGRFGVLNLSFLRTFEKFSLCLKPWWVHVRNCRWDKFKQWTLFFLYCLNLFVIFICCFFFLFFFFLLLFFFFLFFLFPSSCFLIFIISVSFLLILLFIFIFMGLTISNLGGGDQRMNQRKNQKTKPN